MQRNTNIFMFGLYFAAAIIGAGVLTMPLVAPLLGSVPLLGLTVTVGLGLMAIYVRMAESIVHFMKATARRQTSRMAVGLARGAGMNTEDPTWSPRFTSRMVDRNAKKGQEVLDDLVEQVGLNSAGKATLLFGTLIFVLFADVGYLKLGGETLSGIAGIVQGSAFYARWLLLAVGLLLAVAVIAMGFARGQGVVWSVIRKFLTMAALWLGAVSLLTLLPQPTAAVWGVTLKQAVGAVTFLIAVVWPMYVSRQSGNDAAAAGNGLNAQHGISVIIMVVELTLLAVCAGVALLLTAHSGGFVKLTAWSVDGVTADVWPRALRVLGVVLFAFVTTGVFNLIMYPQLFAGRKESDDRSRFRQVAVVGTLVPMVVYLGWTLVSVMTLTAGELGAADGVGATHSAIATKLVGLSGGWIVTLTGNLFALMALTSACASLTESLSERIQTAFRRHRRRWAARLDYRPLFLIAAAMLSLLAASDRVKISLSAILSIAGNAGGGLLVVILPLLFPHPFNRRTRPHHWEVALAFVFSIVLMCGVIWAPVTATGAALAVVFIIKVAVSLAIFGMTLWLLLSEPPDKDSPQSDPSLRN